MKARRTLTSCALLAAVTFAASPSRTALAFEPSASYDSNPTADYQIAITAEVVAIPLVTYRELTKDGTPAGDASEFRAKLGELIDAGKAVLETVATVRTRSGQRAKTESGKEKIYATEYDENGIPGGLETRPLGTILEVDPVIGADEFTVELNVALEIVEFAEMEKSTYTHQKSGKEFDVELPLFYSRKVTTAITTTRGGWNYAGVLGVKGDRDDKSGKIGLLFIGVDGVK